MCVRETDNVRLLRGRKSLCLYRKHMIQIIDLGPVLQSLDLSR